MDNIPAVNGQTSPESFLIPEDQAIAEIKEFIEFHLDEIIEPEQVAKDYKETVKALRRGLLNISDPNTPVLKLKNPVKYENGGVDMDSIVFLTRVHPLTVANLGKGIDFQKDALTFANKMTAYIIQQPSVAMLNKFSKIDYKVIQQLAGLFQ